MKWNAHCGWIGAISLVEIILLSVLAFIEPAGHTQNAAGKVDCYFGPPGMVCVLTRIQGNKSARLCWDVNATCRNGGVIQWSGCNAVPEAVGQTAVFNVPAAEVPGLRTCDLIVSSSLGNARGHLE